MNIIQVKLSYLAGALAILLVLVTGADSYPHETPITGQYIGARDTGEEHLLLFQLPKTISSQLQQHQQPRYIAGSSSYLQQHADSLIPHSSEPTFIYQQQQQPSSLSSDLGGQQISLTIPISTLAQKPHSDRLVDYFLGEESSTAATVTRQAQPQQQQVADSTVVSVNPRGLQELSNELARQNMTMVDRFQEEQQQQQQQQQQEAVMQPTQQQRMANLTATIEQHLKQILHQHQIEQQQQQPQYVQLVEQSQQTTTTEPSIMSYTTLPPQYEQEQQPKLWRDTQPQQQEREPLSDNSASLLTRLANSSPELLLRLRSRLNRVARQRQLAAASGNYSMSDSVKSLYPNGGRAAHLLDMAAGQQPQDSESLLSPLSKVILTNNGSSNGSMLNTFLTSHNLSSHEEIKIPLVVIAMPRILSLKRNNLASSYPNSNNSSGLLSGLTTSPSVGPSADAAMNLIQQTVRSTLANLTQGRDFLNHPMGDGSGGNRTSPLIQLSLGPTSAGSSPLSTEALLNSTRDARLMSQLYSSRRNSLYGEQEQQATTSSPPHTMAPYARQFQLPIAPSFVSHYNLAASRPDATEHQQFSLQQQQQQPTTTIRIPRQHQHNQTHIEVSLQSSSEQQQQQQQHQLHHFDTHQLTVPLIETILASQQQLHPNYSQTLLRQLSTRPAADQQQFQIRLVSDPEHADPSAPRDRQNSNHQQRLRLYQQEDVQKRQQQLRQPSYELVEVQNAQAETPIQQRRIRYDDEPVSQQERRTDLSDLAAAAAAQQQQQLQHRQRRQRTMMNEAALLRAGQQLEVAERPLDFFNRPYPPNRADPSSQQHQQIVHYIDHSQVGRQSPLLEDRISRLRPLFRASNNHGNFLERSSLSRREGIQQGVAIEQQDGQQGNPKKSPKMVLMIV